MIKQQGNTKNLSSKKERMSNALRNNLLRRKEFVKKNNEKLGDSQSDKNYEPPKGSL